MATTSFTKNFKVSKSNAKAFVNLMTKPAKPLLKNNFKSSFRSIKNDPSLKQQLKEAMNNND